MADDATFRPVERDSDEPMFGPRAVLACGLSAAEQARLTEVVRTYEGLSLVVAHEADREVLVGELLERAAGTGVGRDSSLPRLVLMSGLTQRELHDFMAGYRSAGLPRPLWAAATPTSVTWPLGELLSELERERAAVEGEDSA